MPIANDMRHIAEGIEVSYGERVAFLSDLFQDTHETLKTFHREHQKMSTDLWDFLTSDRDNRERIVASLLGKNKRELKAMAEKLAHDFRESTSATKKETDDLLSSFHASHEAMAKDLRKSLSSEIKRLAGKVKEMLSFFDGEHKAKSDQIKKELYSFNEKLSSSVEEIRNTNRSDQRQARRHWQDLVRIMVAKRAGKVVTPAKKIAGVAKKEVAEAVEAFSAGNLKEQILRLISETTSGISLAQMGMTLRIPYVRLAKPASELVNEGKIEKEDSEYFKV